MALAVALGVGAIQYYQYQASKTANIQMHGTTFAEKMDIAKVVLAYIRAILSWPVIAGLATIVFFRWFKEPLSDFFRRLVKGQLYGASVEAISPVEQSKKIEAGLQQQPEEEIEKYIRENPAEVYKLYTQTFRGYWFERAYNLIFGTQISLLEYLLETPSEGKPYAELFSFHQEFLTRSAGLATIQMADYVGFLRNIKFLENVGEDTVLHLKLTPEGVDFLSYIKVQYPLTYKHKAF